MRESDDINTSPYSAEPPLPPRVETRDFRMELVVRDMSPYLCWVFDDAHSGVNVTMFNTSRSIALRVDELRGCVCSEFERIFEVVYETIKNSYDAGLSKFLAWQRASGGAMSESAVVTVRVRVRVSEGLRRVVVLVADDGAGIYAAGSQEKSRKRIRGYLGGA